MAVLQREEGLLEDILRLAEQYEEFADTTRLPEQLQDEPTVVEMKQVPATAASRPSAPSGIATAGKKATAKTGAKKKPRQPLLGDLLATLLANYDEPRLAKELRDELLEKHPDRTPTPQVVRNTLESLVAKGRIRRHRQKRSVLYTLVEPDAD